MCDCCCCTDYKLDCDNINLEEDEESLSPDQQDEKGTKLN